MRAKRQTILYWFLRQSLTAALLVLSCSVATAQRPLSVFDDHAFEIPFENSEFANCENCDTGDEAFGGWGELSPAGSSFYVDQPTNGRRRRRHAEHRPFDWVRHFGFRHSSTHGRHVDRGLPLQGTSWLNRPYHVDWFSGTLLGDNLVPREASLDNELFAGFRLGKDFDYYWGIESRFGWSRPNIQTAGVQTVADNGSFFISDVSLLYYPWGDSKVRPYMQLGAGMTRLRFADANDTTFNTTLFTMPYGMGVQIMQSPSVIWRFDVLNNLSFGADGVNTLSNLSLTAGMEFRLGSRPSSYWPWRASRKFW